MIARMAASTTCVFLWLGGSVADLRSQPPPAKVRVTIVSADGSMSDVHEQLQARQLIGEYDVGDGLGYNLNLILKEGGKFECKWLGCLGVYGTSSGAWTIQDTGLKLAPEKADGMLKDRPVDRMRVLSLQKNYFLLQERDSDWLKEYGPDTYCCFHQSGGRKTLEEYQRGRVKKAVNEMKEPPEKSKN
jgi:hypothetical protein